MLADRKAGRQIGRLGQYYQIYKWNGGRVGVNVCRQKGSQEGR